TMSSFLPNVIVTQTLKDVQTTSIRASNDLAKKVQRGLDRLYGFQHSDGGWGWWKDDQTNPIMMAYVVDGLMMESRVGLVTIETYRIVRARAKLEQMINSNKAEDGKPIDPETQ